MSEWECNWCGDSKCQCGPRVDAIRATLREREAELAEAKKTIDSLHEEVLDEIQHRDHFENQCSDMAAQAGCSEEWSNLHDHSTCVREEVQSLLERMSALESSAARYKQALEWMLSRESDWADGAIGVGHCFREKAREALRSSPAPVEEKGEKQGLQARCINCGHTGVLSIDTDAIEGVWGKAVDDLLERAASRCLDVCSVTINDRCGKCKACQCAKLVRDMKNNNESLPPGEGR